MKGGQKMTGSSSYFVSGHGRQAILDYTHQSLRKQRPILYHGSGVNPPVIEPSRPVRYDDDGFRYYDGGPCVCTTPVLDIAVFHAMFNRRNFNDPSKFWCAWTFKSSAPNRVRMAASRYVIDHIKDSAATGFIHTFYWDQVVPPSWFGSHSFMLEIRTNSPVRSGRVFSVDFTDLPPALLVIEAEDPEECRSIWGCLLQTPLRNARRILPITPLDGIWWTGGEHL